MRYAIENIKVVDPFRKSDSPAVENIYIEDGKFVEALSAEADKVIEGDGLVATPGFIDPHTHLRDPGLTYKEDIISGTKAAAAGGFVAVAAMPNTKPVCDTPEIVKYMIDKAHKEGFAEVLPIAAVTIGEKGKELSDFAALKEAGAPALTDDGRPVATAAIMREALLKARDLDLVIIDHPEDTALAWGTHVNLGKVSAELKLKGMPNSAEAICVARDIILSMEVDAPVHLCHLSTKESVELVRWGKAQGAKITADACPHHFWLTDEALLEHGSFAKMYPPLRQKEDCQAVAEGIMDGTIDMIGTDHAPHSLEEKGEDIEKAFMGIIGLETAFPLSYTKLCRELGFSFESLIERLALAAAKLFKLGSREIKPGNPAHLTILDLDKKYLIDPSKSFSKSRNTPFGGTEVQGAICYTFWGGRLTYEA